MPLEDERARHGGTSNGHRRRNRQSRRKRNPRRRAKPKARRGATRRAFTRAKRTALPKDAGSSDRALRMVAGSRPFSDGDHVYVALPADGGEPSYVFVRLRRGDGMPEGGYHQVSEVDMRIAFETGRLTLVDDMEVPA